MMGFNFTLAASEAEIVTPVLHPKVPLELRKLNPRTGDPNHVTVVSVLAGVPDVIDSVIWSIIGQVIGPVAYDELRTRKQVGYVVSGGVGKMSNVLALSVVVQGKEMMPDETEAAIDMVLTKLMPERLASMTDEQFESYKEATSKAFLKPPLGFSDEINQYWPSVAAMGQCFEKRQDELDYLRNGLTSKKQLLDAYMSIVLPKAQSVRSKVVVKYWSQESGLLSRPEWSTKKKQMEDAGVPAEGITQAEKEYKETKILNNADSPTRSQFARLYGHFTDELKCRSTTAQKEATVEGEKDVDEAAKQEEIQQTNSAETDAARVAVGSHDPNEEVVKGMEEVVAAEAPTSASHTRRKKRADSAMSIDSAARLSVDDP